MITRSYKAEMQAPAGDWNSNGLRFATEEAASSYGFDLLLRWAGAADTRAVPCEDEPTLDSSTVRKYEELVK